MKSMEDRVPVEITTIGVNGNPLLTILRRRRACCGVCVVGLLVGTVSSSLLAVTKGKLYNLNPLRHKSAINPNGPCCYPKVLKISPVKYSAGATSYPISVSWGGT